MQRPRRHAGGSSVACLASLLLVASACSSAEEPQPPHVLFILVDTLRADHTSLDGYARETTPRIDALAAQGTTFRRHFVNAPWTKPSVASILTGLLPPAHGSQWGDFDRASEGAVEVDLLARSFDTLPEILRRNGYSTVCLMTNETLTPELGYDQGFDEYVALPASLAGDLRAVQGAREALDQADRPTFVWCHLMAPHNYRLPPQRPRTFESEHATPIRPQQPNGQAIRKKYGMLFREQAVDVYDETLLFTDELVAALVEEVRRQHPHTIVVLTSDHGEELGEHGGYLHNRTLFNELLRVPLVIWGPGVPAGETVERLTQSVDLLPTVLDLVGLPQEPSQGHPLFGPAPPREEVYAEKRNGLAAKRALITPAGKLIESKPRGPAGEKPPMEGESRFKYFRDPAGADDQDEFAQLPPAELDAFVERIVELWRLSADLHAVTTEGEATRGRLSPEALEALRRLGYVE